MLEVLTANNGALKEGLELFFRVYDKRKKGGFVCF